MAKSKLKDPFISRDEAAALTKAAKQLERAAALFDRSDQKYKADPNDDKWVVFHDDAAFLESEAREAVAEFLLKALKRYVL